LKKALLSVVGAVMIFSSGNLPSIAKASEVPSISVKLKNYVGSQNKLTVTVKGKYDIPGSNLSLVEGKTYIVKLENNRLSLYENGTLLGNFSNLSAVPQVYGTNNYIFVNNHPYLGNMNFTLENNVYIRPINTLPMEDYLKGVVPFEVSASWNKEALKAQAVAARTYAVKNQSSNMDDTTSYQAYAGYMWDSRTNAAVDETNSQTLTYNGKTIDAFYSASNGGMTESNANVWGGTPLAFYPVKLDPYDTKVPWGFTMKKTQIDTTSLDLANPQNWWNSVNEADTPLMSNFKNWMAQNGYANYEIKIISVPTFNFSNDRTTGNRVKYTNISLQFFLKDKTTGQFVMENNQIKVNTLTLTNTSAAKVRAMVGASIMKSYLISNFSSDNTSYTVNGLGNGHGVGMSQWGAKVMADQGFSYNDILSFYFPGTALTNAQSTTSPSPLTGTSSSTSTASSTSTGSSTSTSPSTSLNLPTEIPSISYTSHVQDYGWLNAVSNGNVAGTTGQSKRMEAIKISIPNVQNLGVKYSAHVQDYGWLNYVSDGQIGGTTGQSRRMEAIKIELTGTNAAKYDIYYRVHSQDYGWLGWAKNGEAAGTQGLAKRMEAIEIVLVQKGGTAPGTTNRPFIRN
jgi:SpoIID/LytB domain protein